MKATLKRWIRIGGGGLLTLTGLAGLALPIMPGWILLIPGLILLSREFHWAKRLLERVKHYMPKKSGEQSHSTQPGGASGSMRNGRQDGL
jgi:hypothetical protein